MTPPVLATYRLQLHAGFPLARARDLVPYLDRLGVSHLYCSPILQPRRGSTHGYDVADPARLNAELGTEADLESLAAEARGRGMGIVLDIVPNHQAASAENPAWDDVLAFGRGSPFARWFDIEWRVGERELRSRVLLPVLGDLRPRVLDRGEIALALEDGRLRVRYYEHSFPLDPATVPDVLDGATADCADGGGGTDPACARFAELLGRLRAVPRRRTGRPAWLARRRTAALAVLAELGDLWRAHPHVAAAAERAAARFGSGGVGRERLRRLLDAQVYRLVHWRRAARELNYRRFFDINDLVALHAEDPVVFAETHGRVLEWVGRGWVQGLRIDHVDGLLDPLGYLRRLAAVTFPAADPPPVYVEKILMPGERLRTGWPVAGTTGYDFLNEVEALFLDPGGWAELEADYRRVAREPMQFATVARAAKRAVLEASLAAGVRRLAERLLRLSGPGRPLPPIARPALGRAVAEAIVALPVYRTYVDERIPVPAGTDRRLLVGALADARALGRAGPAALEALADVLLGAAELGTPEHERLRLRFVERFQQLSGPAAAKGIEDTAFYAYAPLLSRNEVGGAPDTPLADAVRMFHEGNRHRAECWPAAMLAASTHDTKRSADARARLDVLTEVAPEWAACVARWHRWNRPHRRAVRGRSVPDAGTVFHVLQAIVALWPVESARPGAPPPDADCLASLRERVGAYALKAAREAERRTSWVAPDEEFEAALADYVEAALCPRRSPRFVADVGAFARRVGRAGLWNSLARTVLQLASPGVPDIYQGDELWNLALVDPDNRRPVDFDQRVRLLDEVAGRFDEGGVERDRLLAEMVREPEDGRIKLHVTRAALAARRRHPRLFVGGSYLPLFAAGGAGVPAGPGQLVAFGRAADGAYAVAVAPRLVAAAAAGGTTDGFWAGLELPLPEDWPREWRCALSGAATAAPHGALRAADVLARLPVALLVAPPA